MFPRKFEKYKKLVGEDFLDFLKPTITSIRINTLKIERKIVIKHLKEKGYKLEQIPYYENGFKILNYEEKNVAKEIEHALGYFFIQDASSMIPPLILNPKQNEIILDMCAAPGAKTTQLAQLMENKGIIVANDVTAKRIKALSSNLQRMGVLNTIVIQNDGRFLYKKLKIKFDKILLDVPCSASGTFNSKTLLSINKRLLNYLSELQKKLLFSAFHLLKENGIIVYSTCSLEPEENEEVIDYGVKKLGLEVEKIKIRGVKTKKGLTEWENKRFDESISNCLRIIEKGQEGFFVAKLRKC